MVTEVYEAHAAGHAEGGAEGIEGCEVDRGKAGGSC